MPPDERESFLSASTLVPIGMAAALAGGAIAGAWTISGAVTNLRGELETLRGSIGRNTSAVERLSERIDTRWSRDDQAEFWELFKAMNPQLEVSIPPIRRKQ